MDRITEEKYKKEGRIPSLTQVENKSYFELYWPQKQLIF